MVIDDQATLMDPMEEPQCVRMPAAATSFQRNMELGGQAALWRSGMCQFRLEQLSSWQHGHGDRGR